MIDWLPDIDRAPSPHHSDRRGLRPAGIVFHYDASPSDEGGVQWMCSAQSKVSAHLHVNRAGRIRQLVALDRAAWHAGVSSWVYEGEQREDCNDYTIGIELANLGRVYERKPGDFRGGFYYEINGARFDYPEDRLHSPVRATLRYDSAAVPEVSGWWEAYSGPLIYSLARLVDDLRELFGPLPLVGHEEIAMPLGRKSDPGPAFPWDAFDRMHDLRRTSAVRGVALTA